MLHLVLPLLRSSLVSCSAGRVRYAVLDEADKVLDLGFQPQIEALKALLLPATAKQAEEQEGGAKKKAARRVQVGPKLLLCTQHCRVCMACLCF